MAVINGTSAIDIINDTIGDDVINGLGANSTNGQGDTIYLSGGNDVINLSNQASLVNDIHVNTSHMDSITVNGDGGYIFFDQNSLVEKINVNTGNGATITAANVSSTNGIGSDDCYYHSGYFSGQADAVNVDLRNVKIFDSQNPYENRPYVEGDIGKLSVQYGQNGGSVDATLHGCNTIDFQADTAVIEQYNDIISVFSLNDSHNVVANIDYKKSNQNAFLYSYEMVNQEPVGVYSNYASFDYKGSHGDNVVQILNKVNQSSITTFEGNDKILLSNVTGSISTGAGSDFVRNDSTWKNSSGVVHYESANQTIDLGASGTAQSGNVTFRINAYSSLVDGVGAHASVYAGGKKIGEFQANNNATTGQDFTITTAAANLLNGELAILFDNDKYIAATSTAAAQDRNLYIREVEMINPDGYKETLWSKMNIPYLDADRPVYDRTNAGAPTGVNSAFDGQNTYAYTPYSTGTIGMAWSGALKFNLDTRVAGIDIADGGNGSDTYLFDRNSGRDRYRDTGTQAGDVDVLKFAADVRPDQIWLSRDAQAKIHVGIIGTANDAVINGIDHLQAGGKTLAAADFDKLIQAMASVTPPTMGQLDLNATQHQKLDTVIAANWH